MSSQNLPEPRLSHLSPLQTSNANHTQQTSASKLIINFPESDPNKKVGKWTPEEDSLLRKYVSQYSEKQWKKISEHIPGRTPIQCLHRWTKILKPGLVKGPWTQEEDQKLLGWIKKEGPGKWAQAANLIPGRSGKQCRERWFNNLNPNVKKGNWSSAEDELIFELYQKYGSSWSKIAKYIPGRTENSIKNRFYSTLRKLAAAKHRVDTQPTGSENAEGDVAQNENHGNPDDINMKLGQSILEKDPQILKNLLKEIKEKEGPKEESQATEEFNVKHEEDEEEDLKKSIKNKKKELMTEEKPNKVFKEQEQEKVPLLGENVMKQNSKPVLKPDQAHDLNEENSFNGVNNSNLVRQILNDTCIIPGFLLEQQKILQSLISAFKGTELESSNHQNEKIREIMQNQALLQAAGQIQSQQDLGHHLNSIQHLHNSPPSQGSEDIQNRQGFQRRQHKSPKGHGLGDSSSASLKIPPLDIKAIERLKIPKFEKSEDQNLSTVKLNFKNNTEFEDSKENRSVLREQKNEKNKTVPLEQGYQMKSKSKKHHSELEATDYLQETFKNLIKSIHNTIASASLIYSQCLVNINDTLKNIDRNDDSNQAREKIGDLFRQLYGLESWLKNAKVELGRLEGFVQNHEDRGQMSVESEVKIEDNDENDENKRKLDDMKTGEQPVKKRKLV